MLLVVASSRRPLRVLHTADVHLDSDGYGNPAQQAAHAARGRAVLRAIVDRALTDRVDLLLIAGDLFDHNRASDETVAFVRAELERLRQPVVILPGNHDALCTNAIYDRHDFSAGAGQVRVIRRLNGETIDFPELDAVVWGRAMEEHTPEFQPLAFVPGRDDRRWCLAMAHGFYYAERQRPDRSSPIFADEVRDTGWDYVALGHQHVRTDVSQGGVVAHYAGVPASEWIDGHPEGFVLRIDLSVEHGIRVEPRPLGDQGRSCETAMVDSGVPSGVTRAEIPNTSLRA
jgi:DNA repair exonuclease SbcCD nuclease subunit